MTTTPRRVLRDLIVLPSRVALALEADSPMLLGLVDAHPGVLEDLRGMVFDRNRYTNESAVLVSNACLSLDGRRLIGLAHRDNVLAMISGDTEYTLAGLRRPSPPGVLSVVFSFDDYTGAASTSLATLRTQVARRAARSALAAPPAPPPPTPLVH